jgi:hypothetical protein
LSWTRESRDLKFSRAISGQSAASAAHLPRREGCTVPHPAWEQAQGLLRCGARVTAGAFALPNRPGVPEPEDSRISNKPGTPAGGKRRGSGRVWCARTDPVPCGTTCPYGPTDLPPTEGRTSWRAVNSLTRRWSAKSFTGAGGVGRQQLCMQLSKNRSVTARLQRPWRLHRVGGLIGRPGRWSPGWSRFLPIHRLHPASSWGHQGVDRRDQTPGLLRALPATGSTPGRQLPAALSGFHAIADRGSA